MTRSVLSSNRPDVVSVNTSTRLQVETIKPSRISSPSTSSRRLAAHASSENASRSRTAIGADLWFTPTRTIDIVLTEYVVAAHQSGAEECAQHQDKTCHTHPCCPSAAPTRAGPIKNQKDVKRPGERRKNLLRVVLPD